MILSAMIESSVLGYQMNEMIDGVVYCSVVDGPINYFCNLSTLNLKHNE